MSIQREFNSLSSVAKSATRKRMTTKCELLGAMQREINRARASGRKSISVDLETFLQAMQLDDRGRMDDVETVLQEMCEACACYCTRMSENHREVITFILSRSAVSFA
jgi:hypothetical protein